MLSITHPGAVLRKGTQMKIIHHVLDIDAGTPAVWAALTTSAGLAGWWTAVWTSPAMSARRSSATSTSDAQSFGPGKSSWSASSPSRGRDPGEPDPELLDYLPITTVDLVELPPHGRHPDAR